MIMEYKTMVAMVAIVTVTFVVSCDQKPSNSNRGSNATVPSRVDPPPPEPSSVKTGFSHITGPFARAMIDKHEMLSPEASKDWLRKNYWEVTSHSDGQIIIQRNYKSENRSDEIEVSLGSKGQRGISVVNNALFTVDDKDNIRVGHRKSENN